MKKIITALILTLALSASTLADGITTITGFSGDIPAMGRDGNTPHTGYAGCEGGYRFPELQVCCMPGEECAAGRSAALNSNNLLSRLIGIFGIIDF